MHAHTKTVVAGGAVRPARVVYLSGEYIGVEMSTNLSQPHYGIAQEYSRQPPGTPFAGSYEAALSGDELQVHVGGATCLAECGNTVTAGKFQTVDSTARITDAVGSPPWSFDAVCQALENGTAGDRVRVRVL